MGVSVYMLRVFHWVLHRRIEYLLLQGVIITCPYSSAAPARLLVCFVLNCAGRSWDVLLWAITVRNVVTCGNNCIPSLFLLLKVAAWSISCGGIQSISCYAQMTMESYILSKCCNTETVSGVIPVLADPARRDNTDINVRANCHTALSHSA